MDKTGKVGNVNKMGENRTPPRTSVIAECCGLVSSLPPGKRQTPSRSFSRPAALLAALTFRRNSPREQARKNRHN